MVTAGESNDNLPSSLGRRGRGLGQLRPRPSPLAAPDEAHLLSTVAHELRTPLQALTISAEMLVEDLDALDPKQVHSMLSSVHRSALWLQGLVENLLCAATIREGRFQIHPRPISMGDVVAEVRPVVEPLLAQRRQRLRVSSGQGAPMVSADSRRVGQVLVNLVTNASKFSGPDTTVDVRLAARRDRVRVTVADRGPGFPDASAARLFSPFYQAASSTAPGKEGVGLGLAIVSSIVEAHAGRVGAANRRGGGARFWFELPATPLARLPRAEREMIEETH